MKALVEDIIKKWRNRAGDSRALIEEVGKVYHQATGKRPRKKGCSVCAEEAVLELELLLNQKQPEMTQYELKNKNALIYFNFSHYTNATLTDSIVMKMIERNRDNSNLFENPQQVLDDFDSQNPQPEDHALPTEEEQKSESLPVKVLAALAKAGITPEQAKTMSVDELTAIKGIGKSTAEKLAAGE